MRKSKNELSLEITTTCVCSTTTMLTLTHDDDTRRKGEWKLARSRVPYPFRVHVVTVFDLRDYLKYLFRTHFRNRAIKIYATVTGFRRRRQPDAAATEPKQLTKNKNDSRVINQLLDERRAQLFVHFNEFGICRVSR